MKEAFLSAKIPKVALFVWDNEPNISRRFLLSRLTLLRPNSDLSQTSHCNIKGLSVSEVMRIEIMIAQVKFF